MVTLLVTLAAGMGAVTRYVADTAVQRRSRSSFPYGTVVVNLTGSFLLGLVTGLTTHHGFPSSAGTVVGAGFAGGYTTLSTWAWESVVLAESGAGVASLLNVAGSIALGLVAAAAGLGLALV
jgi:CrcB protein